ncbi:MAG TPA: VWA domain-containing protein [Kineosporiaceae bacterium]|nr:VWA domain-containing protein [Kineosporiaceae bacterium]
MAAALLRGVDRAAFAVAFAVRLRGHGIAVGFSGIETFTRALAVAGLGSVPELYWVARISLLRRERDLAVFDRVFAAVFDEVVLRLDPNARRGSAPRSEDGWAGLPDADPTDLAEEDGGGLPWATLPTVVTSDESTADTEIGVPQRLPSQLEGLADTPFDQLDPAQLALLGAWFETALARWPTRRTRRTRTHPAGRTIALRPTLAQARRTGWEPIELVRTKPVRKRRRVVMLVDVSQSMQPYATAYLHLMRAAAVSADAEVFAFATALTRLTTVLNHHHDAEAIELAGRTVIDRFGGTRIATNLRALLRSRHGGVIRGAIVLIASDGWDSDDPDELAAGMARLRRRAHRVIWLNPRAAAPGYAPLVGAMAAALPYCDELLPAHTLRAMDDVLTAVTR